MRINLSPTVSFEWLEGRRLMSTYYVTTGGNDSGAGTAAAPWKTLQKAADTVVAGDTVNIAAGDYAGFSKYTLRGTAANHITFQANGAVNIVSRATAQTQLDVGIELSGFDASSGSAYVDVIGITVNNASNTIVGAVSSGFRVRYSNNIRLINCKATNCGWVGFYNAYSSYITIDGCESSFNNKFVDSSTQRNHGIYCANSSSHFTIRNCYVHDNNGNGIHSNGDGGVISYNLYEGNIVANNGTLGGSAFNCDGVQNSIFRNNLLYGNKNKGFAFYNIDGTDGPRNNIIVNNTVVMAATSGNAAFQLKGDASNNKIINNIFIHLNANGVAVDFYNEALTADTLFDNNIYGGKMSGDGSLQTLATWKTNYDNWDANSMTGTAGALFVNYTGNDFHLSATSAAIDKGTSTNAPTNDQDLAPRPQGAGFDIGAYEYGSGAVTVPNAPTALGASALQFNLVRLTWTDNATNETGFKIERRIGTTGTWAPLTTVGGNTTTYDDTSTAENTTYYYRMVATNSAGDSGYSNTDSALTPAAPSLPAAPSGTAATAYAYNNIGLVWTDNSADETGFKIERRTGTTGTFAEVATVGANVTTWTDTTVAGNTTYYYRVRATNAAGDSAYSNMDSALTPVQPTAPASPTGLALNAVAYNQVNLTWADNSNNEDGFRIERKVGAGSFALLINVAAGTTSYNDTTVSGGTLYSYRVRSYNTVGNSVWSNNPTVTTAAAPTTPAAPTGLGATAAGTDQINLAWTDASSNETGFKIEQQVGGGAFVQIATVGAGVTSYNVTSLTAGTAYNYRVRATNAQGDSAYSNTAGATTASAPTAPTAPSNLAAQALSDTQVKLTWTDNAGNETGFRIDRDVNGTFIEVGSVGANVTTWTESSLTAQTQYSYRIVATNAVGDSSYSNTASATTQAAPTAPAAPGSLTATVAGVTQINLTWADNSNNETGFKIERSLDGSTWSQVGTVGAGITAYQSTGLTGSTDYFYRVRATNAVGDSDYSNTASATTQAAPTVPAAPGSLSATAASVSQINLSWADNSSDETGFKIERSPDGSTWIQIGTVGAGVTSYQSTGLASGTQYFYRVRATNAVGDSSYSNAASATTTVQTDTTAPTATGTLGGLTAAGDGTYTFKVAYGDNNGVDATTIDGNDVRVTGPNGFNQLATLVSVSGTGANRTATYRVHSPGTTWAWTDDGAYTFTMEAGQVKDLAGNAVAAAGVGTINALIPSIDYAGNTKGSARSLSTLPLNKLGVYVDVVETLDVQDWYKFIIKSPMLVTCKVSNLTDDANLQLRALDNTLLQASGRAGTNYEYISRVLKAGTYYYRVLDNAMIGTGYNMRLTTEAPPVAAPLVPDFAGGSRATARNTGTFTSGRTSVYTDMVSSTDEDYYQFDITGTQNFSAKLSGLTNDVNMQLLDASGNQIQLSARSGTNYELINKTLAAGTYYLRLYSASGASSPTTLRMAAA